ncbi:ROK family protein [Priestia aryabhattai]|uniref:ROK family protein n=1 Tax=Priestia aryabhattai TaxID=412384 RepID=UPI0032E853CD
MYLVFDIGGTFVKHALIDSLGNIHTKNKYYTPDNINFLIESMSNLYSEFSNVKGIAVSCPGIVDTKTATIYHGGALPYLHNKNIKRLLERRCDVPIPIENDAKSAALAELWLGSVKGHSNAVVLVLGSAVGGGLIINGKLYRGKNLSAGEVSYMMNGINFSSLKADFLGVTGSAVEMINKIANARGIESSGQQVFELINGGDSEAKSIFEEYCLNLAIHILNLQYLLDPEVIAIGGGISVQPIVEKTIKQVIANIQINNPIHYARPNVVTCKFQSDANLLGALYNFFQCEQQNVLSPN